MGPATVIAWLSVLYHQHHFWTRSSKLCAMALLVLYLHHRVNACICVQVYALQICGDCVCVGQRVHLGSGNGSPVTDWVCVSCHCDRISFFFSLSGPTLLAGWPSSEDDRPIAERFMGRVRQQSVCPDSEPYCLFTHFKSLWIKVLG